MEKEQVIREFQEAEAMLSGHFILSSGLRSATYLQCARVMTDAGRGERLCRALAERVWQWEQDSDIKIDAIVAPAMGGVVVGYELGRQLELPAMFCERVNGAFELRRGFALEEGAQVLIVEDVVTTGKSSMEAAACIAAHGAKPVAVASLIDRRSDNDVSLTLPLISLLALDVPAYSVEALPEALRAIPATKPGSRFLQVAPVAAERPGILITGAARRVGASLARYFAGQGYDIALHYHRSHEEMSALDAELKALGVNTVSIAHDLSDCTALLQFVEKVKEAMPRCSALINNASIFEPGVFMETDEALFDRQFDINFKAPFFLTQAFARVMGKGSVVNMLDTEISRTQGSHFAYLLAKKTLADFTAMAARELGPNIRVNGVCLGSVLPSSPQDAEYMEKLSTRLPLQAVASLDAVASAVRYLLDTDAVTGQLLFVDGGQHLL